MLKAKVTVSFDIKYPHVGHMQTKVAVLVCVYKLTQFSQ